MNSKEIFKKAMTVELEDPKELKRLHSESLGMAGFNTGIVVENNYLSRIGCPHRVENPYEPKTMGESVMLAKNLKKADEQEGEKC